MNRRELLGAVIPIVPMLRQTQPRPEELKPARSYLFVVNQAHLWDEQIEELARDLGRERIHGTITSIDDPDQPPFTIYELHPE